MRVVHCKKEPYTHYIGRPSPLGNPFTHIKDRSTLAAKVVTSRGHAVALFADYARNNHEVMAAIAALPEDAVLGCWCKPKFCHGDIIVELWKEIHGNPDPL